MSDSRFARENQKELNEKHTKILKSLMQRPENKKCADCRRKDPRWASWNLGIFVCIQCSGVHRSIGTHVSKVKSADLDTWTPEQVENMVKWGNEKANLYWEHAWPKDTLPSEKNTDPFIRAKYERKQYAMKGPIPDPSTLGGGTTESPTVTKTGPPAAIVNNNTTRGGGSNQQLFGQTSTAPAAVFPAVAAASASQALFDAFATAPAVSSQQAQKNVKDSIMSMYSSASSSPSRNLPASSTVVADPPMQIFGDFASFQTQSAVPPLATKPIPVFDAFTSLAGPSATTGSKTNLNSSSGFEGFGAFSQPSNSKPVTQAGPAPASAFDAFASLSTPQTSPGRTSSVGFGGGVFGSMATPPPPPASSQISSAMGDLASLHSSTFSSPGLQQPAMTSAPSTNSFGDFTNVISNPTTAISSGFGDFSTASSMAPPASSVSMGGFGDFSSKSSANERSTSQLHSLMPAAPSGFGDFGSFSSPDPPPPLASAISHQPISKGPTLEEALNTTPVSSNFATLPPVEGGWGSFQ